MNTYPEMNAEIVNILRISEEPSMLYAAARIEELECDLAELEADCENWKWQVTAGCAELRKYVEASGFVWCEEESAVFNATTAIGLLSGEVGELRKKIAEMEESNVNNE